MACHNESPLCRALPTWLNGWFRAGGFRHLALAAAFEASVQLAEPWSRDAAESRKQCTLLIYYVLLKEQHVS